jgi:uncharacterized protein (DUF488 family)
MKLFTIGHSNHPIETFLQLLLDHGVQLLVDIRSKPYSRFHPQFNKKNLEIVLPQHSVVYMFAGEALGGRPADPACYRVGEGGELQVDYDLVMQRDWFRQGIEQLIKETRYLQTAIMCAEEDPARCHRYNLIGRYIRQHYPEIEVFHIRKDGKLNELAYPVL